MFKVSCDNCGRESTRIFIRDVPDPTWKFGFRNVFLCHRCIDLFREIMEWLEQDGCLNTMEICRRLNAVGNPADFPDAKEHPEECVKGQKFGIKRKWRETRCRAKENDCVFHYCDVYQALKKLERKGRIHTVKVRFWDKTPLRTDLFRFWFIDREDYTNRVEKQNLTGYLVRNKNEKANF